MQIDTENNAAALALGCQNGLAVLTVLPPPCPLASDAQRKALPRAEKRDWERRGII